MDLDRIFSSPTSPPIYKKKSNPEWCRGSNFMSIFDAVNGQTGLNDLQSVHHQIRMKEGVERKTTFKTKLKLQGGQEDLNEELTLELEEPVTRGRLKRIEEEVKYKLATLKGQEEDQERLVLGLRRFLRVRTWENRWKNEAKSGGAIPQNLDT
ncbi:hypothetical protein CR513_26118, partial [Mucuna pruriens]